MKWVLTLLVVVFGNIAVKLFVFFDDLQMNLAGAFDVFDD